MSYKHDLHDPAEADELLKNIPEERLCFMRKKIFINALKNSLNSLSYDINCFISELNNSDVEFSYSENRTLIINDCQVLCSFVDDLISVANFIDNLNSGD